MEPTATPSDIELSILKAFWRVGAMSAREAHAQVAEALGWSDSTTRTVLERMKVKGLLSRKAVHGVAVYAAAQPKTEVLAGAVKRLLRNVLEVEGALPASAFSGSQILSAEDLNQLNRLLNESEPPT